MENCCQTMIIHPWLIYWSDISRTEASKLPVCLGIKLQCEGICLKAFVDDFGDLCSFD